MVKTHYFMDLERRTFRRGKRRQLSRELRKA